MCTNTTAEAILNKQTKKNDYGFEAIAFILFLIMTWLLLVIFCISDWYVSYIPAGMLVIEVRLLLVESV
jgi:hypothetical protein